MEITAKTKLHPIIGKPIGQSLSSRMGNRVYEWMKKDCYRFPIEIEREDLWPVLDGLRRMNTACIGITKPYKVEVIQYLDEVDDLARKIGAVNSIRVENKRLIGRNLDGLAFLQALQEEVGCCLEETEFFCFGAGGAGKAICCTLAYYGAKKIRIADKFDSFAQLLANDINEKFAPVAEMIPYEDKENMQNGFCTSGVVINASGLGMAPHLGESPAEPGWFEPGQVAFDAVYNPPKTQFLLDAEASGCRIFNGKRMVIGCSMLGYQDRFDDCPAYSVWERAFEEAWEESQIAQAREEGEH